MNLKLTYLVFKNTIQKEWRSKTLFFLLIITVIMISLAGVLLSYFKNNVLTELPMQGLAEQSLGVFFWIINIWSYLVATFIGVSTVRSDQDGGVMAQMLSFPLSRWEYLLGRITGAYTIVTGYYILSLLIGIIGISLALGDFILSFDIIFGMLITSISNLVVITLALFFGLYLGTIQAFIVNFLMTFFIALSNGYFLEKEYFETFKDLSVMKSLAVIFHGIFPHISHWENLGKSFIMGIEFKFNYANEVPHFIATYALLILIIVWVFKRKEV
jgi:ABC-type transport system involved in multi-copper enzyme maturation permease subunit